jgi:hypothetical protein
LTFQDDKPIDRLLKGPGSGEHLLRARPHAYVLGEIFPAHSAGPINQKLSWASYVARFRPTGFMQ